MTQSVDDVVDALKDVEIEEEQTEYINSEDIEETFDIDDEELSDCSMDGSDLDESKNAKEENILNQAQITFSSHANPVYAIACNPQDKKIMISGGGDDTGIIWNRENGEIIHILSGHSDSVVAVGFSFDGTLAATGGYDGIVMIWSVADGTLQKKLEGPSEEIEWISWHQKGLVILAGSSDGTCWMWLATTGDCMHVFAGHEAGVSCGQFSSSGKIAITGSNDNTVRIWNPRLGNCTHVFKGQDFHQAPICVIACHPTNHQLMLSGSQDGTARLIHIQNKKVLAVLDHRIEENQVAKYSVECAGFSYTNNWCATAGLDGNMHIWDLDNFQCRHICRHSEGVTKLAWHPKNSYIITTSIDKKVRVWDARNGICIHTLEGHHDMIIDMELIVEDNKKEETSFVIATASDDGTCRIFKVNLS